MAINQQQFSLLDSSLGMKEIQTEKVNKVYKVPINERENLQRGAKEQSKTKTFSEK